MLTTRQKLFFVRIVSFPVRLVSGIFFKPPVRVRRNKINWCLDLNEAIDLVIFLIGNFEPRTIRNYRQTLSDGAVVFDIGANIGSHTLPLAKIVQPNGMIYAFEPTHYAFDKLKYNVGLNPDLLEFIRVEQILLSRVEEDHQVEEIASSWPIKTNNKTHKLHGGESKTTSGARTTSLDSFVEVNNINTLNLIKIDVDGNELDVLKGALKTINKFKPLIMFELAPYALKEKGYSGPELIRTLKELGYEFSKKPYGSKITLSGEELSLSIPDGSSINLWGIPT